MRGYLRNPSEVSEVSMKAFAEFVLPAEGLGLDGVSGDNIEIDSSYQTCI